MSRVRQPRFHATDSESPRGEADTGGHAPPLLSINDQRRGVRQQKSSRCFSPGVTGEMVAPWATTGAAMTLLSAIMGLVETSNGSIFLRKRRVRRAPGARAGFCGPFQDPNHQVSRHRPPGPAYSRGTGKEPSGRSGDIISSLTGRDEAPFSMGQKKRPNSHRFC